MHVVKLNVSPYGANSYLVNRTLLIDAGMDGRSIISELEKNNIKSLETVILTHCHYDHSGGAGKVAEATGAKIAIHEKDAILLHNAHASVADLFGSKAPYFAPDILLKGGEVFGEFEVMHTPGHTPGSICLYSEKSKCLFSGDTVFGSGSFGRTDLFGGSEQQLVESIKKLTSLDVSVMYPGHGDIVTNANEQIRLSLAMASQY